MSSKKKHKKRKKIFLFSITFRMIALVFAAALTLGYISFLINPAKFWFPSFFGLYFIPLLIINFILLVTALIRRSKSAWIPLVVILPTICFFKYFVQFGNNQDTPEGNAVKILSYNVGRFSASKEEMKKELCRSNIIGFLENEAPSIICLQEFYISDTSKIAGLFRDYPYRRSHMFKLRNNAYFGNLTLSKYPIVSGGDICFKGSTNLSLYCDIDINGTTLRVYNNHLESYNISLTTLIKKVANNDDDISNQLIEVHGKMRGTNKKRAEQVDEILNHIRKCDYLSVISGDFNDTPMSFTFNKLKSGKKDSFVEGGKGLSATYSTFWPLLRIDYILVPEIFQTREHTTTRIPYSDHYPISTKLYLPL